MRHSLRFLASSQSKSHTKCDKKRQVLPQFSPSSSMHTGGLAGGVSDSVGSPPQKPKKPHDYGRSAGIAAKDIKLSGTTSGVSIYKRQRRVDSAVIMEATMSLLTLKIYPPQHLTSPELTVSSQGNERILRSATSKPKEWSCYNYHSLLTIFLCANQMQDSLTDSLIASQSLLNKSIT